MKIKFVDLRLTEAIFQKEDESYLILDFNNQIKRQMNIKNLIKIISLFAIAIILNGCQGTKYNKPFKHNTPLIKDQNIKDTGKSEIAKTLELGPKPVEGDTRKLGKRKKYHLKLKEII